MKEWFSTVLQIFLALVLVIVLFKFVIAAAGIVFQIIYWIVIFGLLVWGISALVNKLNRNNQR